MAKRLVAYELEQGGEVLVEEDVPETGGLAGITDGVVARATKSFEASLDQIRPIAQAVRNRLSELAQNVDEVEVEVKLALKADAVVLTAEGSVKLVMRLKPG